jgi:GNAT superfamily N-acetyltransferase
MSLSLDADSFSIPAPARGAATGDLPRCLYRRLAAAELPRLNDLYNEHYSASRPLEEAQWLYARNPNGPALIYAAFDESGELAGMRPAIPFKLYWRGEERTAYEFADALVAERHRDRGIGSHLVKLICDQADRDNLTLYSLPGSSSLPAYRRSRRLQVLGATETRVRPLAWGPYLAQRFGMNGHEHPAVPAGRWHVSVSDGEVTLSPVDRFDSDFEDLHVELGRTVASFTRRTREYLQWRYFGSPTRAYRVALVRQHGRVRGYVVVRVVDRVAHIVDIFMAPDMALASRTFDLIARWAWQMDATAIHFNASRGSFFHAAAGRRGFWLAKRSGSLVMDRRSGNLLESRQCGPLGTPDAYFVMGDFNFF